MAAAESAHSRLFSTRASLTLSVPLHTAAEDVDDAVASIIDGKAIAATIRGEIAAGVADLKAKTGVVSFDGWKERERESVACTVRDSCHLTPPLSIFIDPGPRGRPGRRAR